MSNEVPEHPRYGNCVISLELYGVQVPTNQHYNVMRSHVTASFPLSRPSLLLFWGLLPVLAYRAAESLSA